MTKQIRTRKQLAQSFIGRGVELGVAKGDYSFEILSNPKVFTLYSIDRWTDRTHLDDECTAAYLRLSVFCHRSHIIRSEFNEALAQFPDGYFDFIYIDGYAHTGQEDGQTLDDWWPKLREGGVFSGHDYSDEWPLTKEAVFQFAKKHNRLMFDTTDDDELPSWFMTK